MGLDYGVGGKGREKERTSLPHTHPKIHLQSTAKPQVSISKGSLSSLRCSSSLTCYLYILSKQKQSKPIHKKKNDGASQIRWRRRQVLRGPQHYRPVRTHQGRPLSRSPQEQAGIRSHHYRKGHRSVRPCTAAIPGGRPRVQQLTIPTHCTTCSHPRKDISHRDHHHRIASL